jgi:hypothetical protein
MRLVIDVAGAGHARVARLPRDGGECVDVTARHEIRAMGLNAHAPYGKTGEASAVLNDVVDAIGGHRLGLGHTVDVYKLGKNETNIVIVDNLSDVFRDHDKAPSGDYCLRDSVSETTSRSVVSR